ncbi:glucose-6-phosphate exchanger SLC37A1 isoform X1 [Pteropus medius]|uniref:glucose-6-phosphate exchanger SLC37A1 isoform X1 n=1 Tax=Pteropus vampyrus TaxID=132908 RepID=UPI00196B4E1F|nr:glucose-6-phosphate exchanger SLC37A1 isoform X1 [Pteropus giganteus]XP_039713281.1 glucose-6-phosphate exchanger SLC37A1 isoform X1 [Pteropus giganteus]
MARLPAGIRFLVSFSRDQWYKAFIFILTFLLYASFHLSRKPISIVKGVLHRYCAAVNDDEVRFDGQSQKASDSPPHRLPDNETDCGWAPFGQDNYQQLLGALDYSFLCAYAVGMYLSGIIGERLPIRYYLTFGMLASGAFTALFGLGYFYDIHSFGFYVVTQVVNGLVQTTGWPSVVTCLGNWFGKGRRGLIMGVWNSHTSVGNILGSLIAGYWASTCWGLSFIVPGAIVAAMGIVCFLFLVEHPKDVACSSTPVAHSRSCENGVHRFRLQKQASPAQASPPGPRGAVLAAGGREAFCPSEPRRHPPRQRRERHGRHQLRRGLENPRRDRVLSVSALREAGQLHFPLLAPSLHHKRGSPGCQEGRGAVHLVRRGRDLRRDPGRSHLRPAGEEGLHLRPDAAVSAPHAVRVLRRQQNGPGSHRRHAAPQWGPGQRAIRAHHHRRLRRPGYAQKSERERARPRHGDRHHRRDGVRRSGPGPPSGGAPVAVGVDQRVLHADVRRRLCLTVPDPSHTQGAELPGVGDDGRPGSV